MQAPCGIEIAFGQTWKSSGGSFVVAANESTDSKYVLVKKPDGFHTSLLLRNFTNKRGGYRFVKGIEQW